MVDVFLIICIIVAFAIMAVAGIYFIVYYQHPDDKNEAYFPKLIVLLGLCLAGGTVLGLPLDVANNTSNPGTRNTCVVNLLMELIYKPLADVDPPPPPTIVLRNVTSIYFSLPLAFQRAPLDMMNAFVVDSTCIYFGKLCL